MTRDCLFCQILSGKKDSEKVYEDDETFSILDINPSAPGHTLVIPKEHVQTIDQLSQETIPSLFSSVQKVMGKIEEALSPDGFNVGWNHGEVAGQAIPHLHVHILPRFSDDKGGPVQAVVRNEPDQDISSIARKIRNSSHGKPDRSSDSFGVVESFNGSSGDGEGEDSPDGLTVPDAPMKDDESEDEDEEEDEEETDERNKSARKQWKEMKKPRY